MKRVNLMFIITISILLIKCGGDNEWASSDQQDWRDTCTSLYADYEYCECTLNYLMEKYPSVSALEQEPDGGFQAGYDAGMACLGDIDLGDIDYDGTLDDAAGIVDDFIEMDPDFSYDSFMEGCMVDQSFKAFCDCAYRQIEIYGFDYYMNNMEAVASDCMHHIY